MLANGREEPPKLEVRSRRRLDVRQCRRMRDATPQPSLRYWLPASFTP
jgi:hypothetical protein